MGLASSARYAATVIQRLPNEQAKGLEELMLKILAAETPGDVLVASVSAL
jgi:hypothetical protein